MFHYLILPFSNKQEFVHWCKIKTEYFFIVIQCKVKCIIKCCNISIYKIYLTN